jgi:hypothetical protein
MMIVHLFTVEIGIKIALVPQERIIHIDVMPVLNARKDKGVVAVDKADRFVVDLTTGGEQAEAAREIMCEVISECLKFAWLFFMSIVPVLKGLFVTRGC